MKGKGLWPEKKNRFVSSYSQMFELFPFAQFLFFVSLQLVFFQARGKDGHARRNERSFPFFFLLLLYVSGSSSCCCCFMRLLNLEIMTPFFYCFVLFFFRKGKGKWGDWQAPQQLDRINLAGNF